MVGTAEGWELELPLAEPGFFKAKAYLLDQRGWQHWPRIRMWGFRPPGLRTRGNMVSCAFPRMFGPGKHAAISPRGDVASVARSLDDRDYTVISPSGKLEN